MLLSLRPDYVLPGHLEAEQWGLEGQLCQGRMPTWGLLRSRFIVFVYSPKDGGLIWSKVESCSFLVHVLSFGSHSCSQPRHLQHLWSASLLGHPGHFSYICQSISTTSAGRIIAWKKLFYHKAHRWICRQLQCLYDSYSYVHLYTHAHAGEWESPTLF